MGLASTSPTCLCVFRLEMFVYLIPILYLIMVIIAILRILAMVSATIFHITRDQIESLFDHCVIYRDWWRPCCVELEHICAFAIIYIIDFI